MLDVVPIEHELTMPFAIAGGGMDSARAVIVRVELADGTVGLGECAPFPAVSGETVTSTIAALRRVDAEGPDALADAPAARCGYEQARLDARLRAAGQSVIDWMPPAVDRIATDITLPVGPLDAAMGFVDDAAGRGFGTLKVKVGGHDLDDDVALVQQIHDTFPALELVLDANGAYDLDAARHLLRALVDVPLVLLEQPLPRAAVGDMATLQRETDVTICLDESLRSLDDLAAIRRHPVLRSVNVKTMKLGLDTAVAVLAAAADAGLTCMLGAMVETRLSITVSAALAMHHADVVRHVDLDTPLFMRPGPVVGGVAYDGPWLSMPAGIVGHGCALVETGGA